MTVCGPEVQQARRSARAPSAAHEQRFAPEGGDSHLLHQPRADQRARSASSRSCPQKTWHALSYVGAFWGEQPWRSKPKRFLAKAKEKAHGLASIAQDTVRSAAIGDQRDSSR